MVDSLSGLSGSIPAYENVFSHGFVRSVVRLPHIVRETSHYARLIVSMPYGQAWYNNAPRGEVGDLAGIAYGGHRPPSPA